MPAKVFSKRPILLLSGDVIGPEECPHPAEQVFGVKCVRTSCDKIVDFFCKKSIHAVPVRKEGNA